MEKKCSFRHRLLALFMLLAMLVTGVLSTFTSSIEVGAWGGVNTGGSVSTGTGTNGDYPTYQGSGWRISLMETHFTPPNESPLKDGTIFSSPKNQLATSALRQSVIVSSTGTTGIKSAYSTGGVVYSVENARVNKISDLFNGLSDDGLNLQPVGATTSESGNLSGDYWNTTFKNYITDNKDKAINNFLSKFGTSIDASGINSSEMCFVVEPVTFWKKGVTIAIGWQDVADGDSISAAFNAAMNSGSPVASYLNSVKTSDAVTLKKIRFTNGFVNSLTIYGHEIKRNPNELDFNLNGYAVFGADVVTEKPGKISASYSLFYNGDATQSNKSYALSHSTSIISKDEYNTIHYNIGNTLPSNAGDLKTWSWHSSLGDPNTKTSAGDTVTHRVTGLTTAEWNNYSSTYANVTAGVQEIKISNASNVNTQKLINAVNNTASNISDLKLTSTAVSVTGGNKNYGKYYTLTYGSGDANKLVSQVANKLANTSDKLVNNSASQVVSAKSYNGNMSNIATNFALKALDESNALKSIADKYTTKNDNSTMGVSVTVMAKKKNITSYVAYATMDRETGNITYNDNKAFTYDVSNNGVVKIPNNFSSTCVYVVISNDGNYSLANNNNGSNIFSKADVENTSESMLKSAAEATGCNKIVGWGTISKGQTINVGTVNGSDGYSVLVLQLKGNVTKRSTIELMDYELNYVYPSMLTSGNYAKLIGDDTYLKTGTETKGSGCNQVTSDTYSTSDDVKVTNKFSNQSSGRLSIVDRNNSLISNGLTPNIYQFDSATGGTFSSVSKTNESFTFTNNLTNVRFSQAVNLVRGSYESKVVSSISSQTISADYVRNNLGLVVGNTSATNWNVDEANSSRNSNAIIGDTITDNFQWNLSFVLTNSTTKHTNDINVKDDCTCFENSCSPVTYNTITGTGEGASWDGTRVKYVVKEIAHKYQTEQLPEGVNNTATVQDSLRFSTSGINSSNSVLVNPYRVAVVDKESTETIQFAVEVPMRAYSTTSNKLTNTNISTGDRTASGAVTPHTVKVLGDYLRKVKPSTMYTIKVTAPNNNVLTGTTLSDSVAVGSNASSVSNGKPVIYAGGDVSLNVKSNYKLNFYGYALDIINPNDNALTGTGNYNSVVADGSNVKSIWGNSNNYNPLANFETWSNSVLDSLAVDATLTVNGSGVNKVYNNFTGSLSNFSNKGSIQYDGVFSISIKKGAVVEDGGYNALIAQIKQDYDLSTVNEAKNLFKNSGIYQSIIDSIEDCNDSFNASQKSNAIDSTRNHWYDEEVKTFVIRRIKQENITLGDTLFTDKIDYGAAPTSGTTVNSTTKTADAKWYFTLYFKSLPNGFTSGTTLYNPSSYNGLANANSAGTVLINECYISGADFVVPSSSTSDMRSN